jgi:hypothetical protein
MTQLDLRPLSVGEILDRTFTLYRRNFLLFIGITAGPQLLVLAAELARTLFFTGPSAAKLGLGLTVTGVLVAIVVYVAAFVAGMFAQAAALLAVTDLYLSRPVGISDCLRRAWAELGTVFGVAILSGLATLAGLIFLVIPGLYIYCRLLVSLPAALIERRAASDALRRAWQLTENHVGRAFLLVVLYIVITMAGSLLFEAPFSMAAIFYRHNAPILQLVTALEQVSVTVMTILVSPLILIATSIFYFDLRVRKEGFDLQFMMDPASERLMPPGTGPIPSTLS